MNKVTSIRGWPIPSEAGEPNQELIEALEELLARARSGNVVGMAAALQFPDNTISWRIKGEVSRAQITGALEAVKYILIKDLVEND